MQSQIEFYESKLLFEMDPSDLYSAFENSKEFVAIDTRQPFGYEKERIPTAINIPHRTMTEESSQHLDKSKTYVCYCDGIGCNASTKGALNMAKLGFKVKELIGGIAWWKFDGYATEGLLQVKVLSFNVPADMIEIRRAFEDELPQIITLCELHAEYEKANYNDINKAKSLKKHLFSEENTLQCLVAIHQNELVGYATFMRQFSTWESDFHLSIDCLFFKELYRRMGLGKRIMEKIKAYASDTKCKTIQWQTPEFNKKAIAFYQKLGANTKRKESFTWEY